MSEAPKSNIIVRFFRGIWGGFNFIRRLVFGLIALFLLLAVLAGLAANVPILQEKTALVIAPKGAIVEQYSSNPIDRALAKASGEELNETQLRDILKALEHAAKDPLIDRVVLVPDELVAAGMSTLIEVGAALQRFKASGKEVIAYGDAMDQRGYYLAAHANQVYLHPEGAVILEGLSRYRTYFKGAFDKLGIEPRLFRVGTYKSAGETYIRTEPSPEAIEADLFWLSDLWQRYLGDVATLRKIERATLAADIDNYTTKIKAAGGDLAQMAKDQGLVDELKTRDELRAMLIEKGVEDEETHSFRQIALEQYVNVLKTRDLPVGKPKVAVVVAEGTIVDGDQPPGMIGGDSTAKLVRTAREDEEVKAVVLRIDSGGGGVFPSEVIRREVELTRKAGKPVIVSMGDVAASGGYWIGMNGDEIVASPSTITGSIGIFALWFNAPQTMDKLGLNSEGAATTWLPGAFNPTREYDPRVGEVIQSVIDRGYAQFVSKVADARGKKLEDIEPNAQGRVWTGAQAKERGLVDRLGTFHDAIAAAAAKAGLGENFHVSYVEKELSAFERFILDTTSSAAAAWVREAGYALPTGWIPEQVAVELAEVRALLRDAAKQRPAAIYAWCECEVR